MGYLDGLYTGELCSQLCGNHAGVDYSGHEGLQLRREGMRRYEVVSKVCLGRRKGTVFKCLSNDELDVNANMGTLTQPHS